METNFSPVKASDKMLTNIRDFETIHTVFQKISEDGAGGSIPVPSEIEALLRNPAGDQALAARWLWLLDSGIGPDRFRRSIEKMRPDVVHFQALVRYFAGKRPPGEMDIERLEWLVTYMFRNPSVSGGHSSSREMLRDIQSWLANDSVPLSGVAEVLVGELVEVLEDVVACRTFKELSDSGLLSRGRGIKQRFRDEFVRAEVLASVVNYNLVSGRKFQQLLAAASPDGAVPGDLASREYRSAAEGFRQWNDVASAVPAAPVNVHANGGHANGGHANGAYAGANANGKPQGPEGSSSTVLRNIIALGIDPDIEEGRLRSMIQELVAFSRAAGRSVNDFPLPNSSLSLSPWEAQSLVVDYPGTEKSFRAGFNRAVRQAVGLLAIMQEESILYDVKRHSEHQWKKHLDTLFYAYHSGQETIADLEALARDAAARGLQEKATQLARSMDQLRRRLEAVANLSAQWKQQSGAANAYGGGFVPQTHVRQ